MYIVIDYHYYICISDLDDIDVSKLIDVRYTNI